MTVRCVFLDTTHMEQPQHNFILLYPKCFEVPPTTIGRTRGTVKLFISYIHPLVESWPNVRIAWGPHVHDDFSIE